MDDISEKWHQAYDQWLGVIQPGSKIAYQRADGTLWTDTVQEVLYTSGSPAIWPDLTLWQRIARRLTPARWRKPLEPTRSATGPTVSFKTGPVGDDDREQLSRAQANIARAGEVIDGLLGSRP